VFTNEIGEWWPLEGHSVHGAGGSVAFVDGKIVECGASGEVAVWGTVTHWEPPAFVAFSWHPGRDSHHVSTVAVRFAATGAQTLVTLEHSDWEVFADPVAARAEYESGWPDVLARYRARSIARQHGTAATWVALLHAPGPAAPADGVIVDQPEFQEHIAFLQRMRDHGYLVAAGPLADTTGHGMTILRLPGANRVGDVERLATRDDVSVASGFLTVRVRPWQVMLSA
jgi:uncharacterized protein YciI